MHSARNSGVFMPVDCAAINETVMESEMFGHARGAFTGADKATLGLIRSADKGTLFLDEVGELSLSMQAKLLRTIQEKTVRPVGSTSLVPVDIRIVAATNRDLVNAVAEGRFRQDLYYRLSAVTLRAPALRERGDDVVRISRFFAKFLQNEGLPDKSFSEKAIQTLMAYPWPGNVRELENTIRSALAFATGDTIDSTDLSIISEALSESSDAFQDFGTSLSDYELDAIRKALKQSAGNRRDAARVLGISESTLYRRIKQYNL
jgi:transcriptional regulator with PAS, ATPase and Fis domain